MWTHTRIPSSSNRSGRSSRTAQCSRLPTDSTQSWTATGFLSFLMASWLSLGARMSCFAKGEKIWVMVFNHSFNDLFSSDGVLAKLAAQTGVVSEERLLEIARASYLRYHYHMSCFHMSCLRYQCPTWGIIILYVLPYD